MTDIRKEIEAKLVNTNEGYALRFKDVQPLAEEITRLRTIEAELKRLKEPEGVEWLDTPFRQHAPRRILAKHGDTHDKD